MFRKIIGLLLLHRQVSLLFAFVYGLLLFVPEPFLLDAPGIRGTVASWGFNALFSLALSWVICFLGELCGRVSRFLFALWHVVFHVIAISYTVSQLFLVSVFNLRWDVLTFQLVSETNTDETSGFFAAYGHTWQLYSLVVFVILLLSVEIKIIRKCGNKYVKLGKREECLHLAFVLSLLSLLVCESNGFSSDPYKNQARADRLIMREGIWELYQSYLVFCKEKESNIVCAESQKNTRIISGDTNSGNIILVIGETFNRHHSSLYGYPLNTNRFCKDLGCIVFEDVMSPMNATTLAFRYFLSFAEVGGEYKWCDTPLFPAIFKQAGYNVVFYSNQYVAEETVEFYNSSAGFFNHPAIYRQLFNHRNHARYDYDMDLIDAYEKERSEIEEDSLNLIIFHLQGQHFPAVERYPSRYGKFTSGDYDRPDLDEAQRQYIAEYDNATLYNDAVVSRIVKMFEGKESIIIYFADHGEEVYDYRDKAGRFSDFEDTGYDGLRYQLDVPFLVFASGEYREKHPDIMESMEKSVKKPFMTDYLPHLLLRLGGIRSEWYESSKDLFDDCYDVGRHRFVSGKSIDYDAERMKSLKSE